MKPTEKELKILRFYAKYTHTEDKYVWLRKDDKGTYIEYAFKDGAPHDNRCLSWYWSYQPNALERNEHDKEKWYARFEKRIGELFRLTAFTCGCEEDCEGCLQKARESWAKYHPTEPFVAEDHICKVGCAARRCREHGYAGKNWTYDEPVKCACWDLDSIRMPERVSIPIDVAMDLSNLLLDE